MGHWVKHLSLKSGDLSSGPRNPCKAGPVMHIYSPSLLLWDGKQTQETLRLRPAGTQESLTNKMEGEHWCLNLCSDLHTNRKQIEVRSLQQQKKMSLSLDCLSHLFCGVSQNLDSANCIQWGSPQLSWRCTHMCVSVCMGLQAAMSMWDSEDKSWDWRQVPLPEPSCLPCRLVLKAPTLMSVEFLSLGIVLTLSR